MLRSLALSLALVLGVAAAPAVLTGCATMPATVTFERSAAEVLASADSVVTLTRTLLRARKIGSDDAENVLKAAETARDGVAIARAMRASNPDAARSRLRLTADALDQLAAYLTARSTP